MTRVMSIKNQNAQTPHEMRALIASPPPSRFNSQAGDVSNVRGQMAAQRARFNIFVIRLTLAILIAAALLSAFGALSDFSKARQVLSCALSCTVCFTAAMHYAGILSLRLGKSNDLVVIMHDKTSTGSPTPKVSADEAFLQDENVDLLRHSDWLITLPLLGVELCNLLAHSNVTSPPSAVLTSILLALVVVFGAVYRFPFKEGRLITQRDESTTSVNRIFAMVSWLIAGGLFAWVVIELLIASARGPETTSTTSTSASTANHTTAVFWFVMVWALYPIISLASLVVIVLNNYTDRQPLPTEWVVIKDTGYAILDVVSKAGLAVYITLNTLSE